MKIAVAQGVVNDADGLLAILFLGPVGVDPSDRILEPLTAGELDR
jgi:hypothetical protein